MRSRGNFYFQFLPGTSEFDAEYEYFLTGLGTLPRPDETPAEEARRLMSEVRLANKGEVVSFLYVIGAETGPLKIGSAVDPASRLIGLQIGNPCRLKVYALKPGTSLDEFAIHMDLRTYRVSGEWFERDAVTAAIGAGFWLTLPDPELANNNESTGNA